jgi:hypothetical protein
MVVSRLRSISGSTAWMSGVGSLNERAVAIRARNWP